MRARRTSWSWLPTGVRIWSGWAHLVTPLDYLDDDQRQDAVLPAAGRPEELGRWLEPVWDLAPKMLLVDTKRYTPPPFVVQELFCRLEEVAVAGRSFVLQRRVQEVIDAGNRRGRFCIRIPYVSAPPPDEPESPYNHVDFEHMVRTLDPLRDAFDASLGELGVLSPEETWGCLFISAMIYGGLTKSAWLLAIPTAIEEVDKENALDNLMLVPERRVKDEGPSIPRRWTIDPTTRLLLIAFHKRGLPSMPSKARANSQQVFKLMFAYARRARFAEAMPRNFSAMVRAVTTSLHEYLPSWLVAYALDRYPSASVPSWVMARLETPPSDVVTELTPRPRQGGGDRLPGTQEKAEEIDEGDDEAGDAVSIGTMEDLGDKRPWEPMGSERATRLRELGSLILKGNRGLQQRLEKWRDENVGQLLPSVEMLAEWAIDWLLAKGRRRKTIGARYLYEKINGAGKRIVGQMGGMDLRHFHDPAAFVEVYQNVLEDAPAEIRHRVSRSLRSLHSFLISRHNAPKLPDDGLFVVGSVKGRIDANFVTVDLFERTKALLVRELSGESEDIVDSLLIIADLGFYVGTRRSEAIGIRLGDLIGKHEFWLRLRPNELRSLKSRNGHRDLPLHVFMPEPSIERLRRFARKQLAVTASLSAPLFPAFIRDGRANDKDPRLHHIVMALRRVADDETLRYHHLRHSFANWFLLRIWIAEANDDITLTEWLPDNEHSRWLRQTAKQVCQALLGRSPTNRRSLMQLSSLLGHSSVDITLHSYIHVADLLLGSGMRRLVPPLTSEALVKISGLSGSYVNARRAVLRRRGPSALLDDIADRILNPHDRQPNNRGGKAPEPKHRAPPRRRPPADPMALLIHIAQAINRVSHDEEDKAHVAVEFGLPLGKLTHSIERARTLPAGFLNSRMTGKLKTADRQSRDIIEFPKSELEQRYAGSTLATWQRLLNKGDDLQDLDSASAVRRLPKILRIATEQWIPGTGLDVGCESLPEARLWCWWLWQLGLGKEIVGTHCDGSSTITRGQQRRYWEDALEIKLKESDDESPFKKISARGAVRIDIDLKDLALDDRRYLHSDPLFGIRFTMGMLWISE